MSRRCGKGYHGSNGDIQENTSLLNSSYKTSLPLAIREQHTGQGTGD